MGFQASDVRLVGAVDEHERSWLLFEIDVCDDGGAGRLRVLEASVRLAGLDDDPGGLRRAIAGRLDALSTERSMATVRDLLCDTDGELRLILWPEPGAERRA